MTRGWLGSGLGQTLLCGLIAAGVINIVATFATPELLQPRAYDRITEKLPANALVVLPRSGPQSQLLPYQEADMQLAVCSYDLSGGPVAAKTVLPGSGWTFALYAPDGNNFYVMPGRDQRTTTIDALLISAVDDTPLLPVGQRTQAAPTQIQVPAATGLLVIRAPIKGESYQAEVEAVLGQASCGRADPRGATG